MAGGGIDTGEMHLLQTAMGSRGFNVSDTNSTAYILKKYFADHNVPVQKAMKAVLLGLQQGVKLMRYKDTVMAYKILSQNIAQFHFFTEDNPHNFDISVHHFLNFLRSKGIKVIYDAESDSSLTKALQMSGARILPSDIPKYKTKAMI